MAVSVPLLTPRIIREKGWEAMAACEPCGFMRTATGAAWKKAADDRDLIAALCQGKLVCFKCGRPTRMIRVGMNVKEGHLRIMTATSDGRVELHDEEPTPRWPAIGPQVPSRQP